jgi:hypothetical protein
MPQRKSGKTARKPARSTAGSGRRIAHDSRRPPARSVVRPEPPADEPAALAAPLSPHELYRHEKRRRAGQQRADARDPLEEARREFKAMIEAGVGTPRGGRPRKVKPRPEDDDA